MIASSVYLLVEHSPQTGAIETEARRLRPDIWRQVKCAVRVEVRMAVEAGNSHTLSGHLPFFSLVEFFLRKRREQET